MLLPQFPLVKLDDAHYKLVDALEALIPPGEREDCALDPRVAPQDCSLQTHCMERSS